MTLTLLRKNPVSESRPLNRHLLLIHPIVHCRDADGFVNQPGPKVLRVAALDHLGQHDTALDHRSLAGHEIVVRLAVLHEGGECLRRAQPPAPRVIADARVAVDAHPPRAVLFVEAQRV